MAISTLTSKGQITVPKKIRDHLSLETGDKVDFVITEVGTVEVRVVERPLEDLYGFLHRPGALAVGLEEMETAIRVGRVEDDEGVRDTARREPKVAEGEGNAGREQEGGP